MTKAKLERLIGLSVEEEAQTEWLPMKEAEAEELKALRAEFEAWEPKTFANPLAGLGFADPLASVDTPQHYERWKQMRDERDEARQIARELLEDADADDWDEHRMQKRYPWLKEKNP